MTATLRGIEQLESKLLATRFKLGNRRNKELELLEAQREGLSNILEVGSKRLVALDAHRMLVLYTIPPHPPTRVMCRKHLDVRTHR